jgi:O-methyltransferase
LDILNHNAQLAKWIKLHSDVTYYSHKFHLYEHVNHLVGNSEIDYLEFGVFKGDSIAKWTSINTSPNSRFYGFDSFEGLPEDWKNAFRVVPKGHFSTHGAVPDIPDPRVQFVKGWFQETLPKFLNDYKPRRMIIHNDSDLYSSTLYVLATLNYLLVPGSIIIFDEFSNPLHEFQAFQQYTAAFMRGYNVVGAAGNYYNHVAVMLT